MKRIVLSLCMAGLLVSFNACDNIDEDNRSTIVENIHAVRPVLLEDFTGQNCVNCPAAAEIAAGMQKIYKDQLVVVGIHAGPFSLPKLKSEAGTAYQKQFYPDLSAPYPAGMIDRANLDGNPVTVSSNPSNWKTYIFNRAQDRGIAQVDLNLTSQYNEAENSFTVTSRIRGISDLPTLKLQIWITESHIIAPQKNGSETIRDYEHNHVLRDAVNGIWGEEIELESGLLKEYTTASYSLEGKDWIPENMHVVGFVYNAATYEVLHVAEISLK